MRTISNRVRYTADDVLRGQFYQLPKFLFEGNLKKGLSCDAKCLYSLLQDRHKLSLSNNWVNENNEVYLIFTREHMANMLGCSQPSLRKTIDQLKAFNLIEEEHMGLNRPNRIYLTSVSFENAESSKITSLECKNLSVRSERIFQSGVKESFSPECKNLSSNKTNINKTNINNQSIKENNNIYQTQENDNQTIDMIDIQKQIEKKEKIKTKIQKNINYSKLIQKLDEEFLDGIVNLIVDVLIYPNERIRISKFEQPTKLVQTQFLKLTEEHIEYVFYCLQKNTQTISNMKNYVLTALYNSLNTKNIHTQKIANKNTVDKNSLNTYSGYKTSYDIDEYEKYSIFDDEPSLQNGTSSI